MVHPLGAANSPARQTTNELSRRHSVSNDRLPGDSTQLATGPTTINTLQNEPTQTERAINNSPSFLDNFRGSFTQLQPSDANQLQLAQGVVLAQQPIPQPDEPAAVELGLDYYEQRAEDFQERNPGLEPPDYYLDYGDKYAERFSSLDATDLSPEGLEWRDKTLDALQQAIEDKRAEDPEGFAELERDPDAFREFAYGTHPDAYVDSGLFDLSIQDITVIGATPDIGDVLTRDGIGQTLVTLGKLSPGDLLDIAKQTVVQTARDLPNATVRQAERIIDRLANQDTDWIPGISFPDIKAPDVWPFN